MAAGPPRHSRGLADRDTQKSPVSSSRRDSPNGTREGSALERVKQPHAAPWEVDDQRFCSGPATESGAQIEGRSWEMQTPTSA
jgi:hypothetical protein